MMPTPLVNWLEENVMQVTFFIELLAIGVSYLLARQISQRLRRYFTETIGKAESSEKFHLKPDRFCTIVKHAFTLLFLWLSYIFLKQSGVPAEIGRLAFYLVFTMLLYRFTSWYISSTFWARLIFAASLLFIGLNAIGSKMATLHLLDSMALKLGHLDLSILDISRTVITFLFLWSVAFMVNLFLSFLLAAASRLNYSDRRHLERIIKFILIVTVVMITLATAGIHPTALTVFGGAAGFALGVGLQKIGSNVVSGIALMLRKPVNQGDVLLMADGSGNVPKAVVVKEIGLIYIHVYTRDGTVELIPNESFVTQKIINASMPVKPIRLRIPFGISYSSDLQKATALALKAAQSVERILPDPEPVCLLKEFAESTVGLELRVWINDPEDGLSNVKSSVLLAVWDIYHTNNVKFSFPQRDLHIKSSVLLPMSGR